MTDDVSCDSNDDLHMVYCLIVLIMYFKWSQHLGAIAGKGLICPKQG